MYNIEELNVKLLSELKEIAEKLNVKNYKKLAKQDLVYKILDHQATLPDSELPKPETSAPAAKKDGGPKREGRPKKNKPLPKRVNVKDKNEESANPDLSKTADELLESFNIELDTSAGGVPAKALESDKPEGDTDKSEDNKPKDVRREDRGERNDRGNRGDRGEQKGERRFSKTRKSRQRGETS